MSAIPAHLPKNTPLWSITRDRAQSHTKDTPNTVPRSSFGVCARMPQCGKERPPPAEKKASLSQLATRDAPKLRMQRNDVRLARDPCPQFSIFAFSSFALGEVCPQSPHIFQKTSPLVNYTRPRAESHERHAKRCRGASFGVCARMPQCGKERPPPAEKKASLSQPATRDAPKLRMQRNDVRLARDPCPQFSIFAFSSFALGEVCPQSPHIFQKTSPLVNYTRPCAESHERHAKRCRGASFGVCARMPQCGKRKAHPHGGAECTCKSKSLSMEIRSLRRGLSHHAENRRADANTAGVSGFRRRNVPSRLVGCGGLRHKEA